MLSEQGRLQIVLGVSDPDAKTTLTSCGWPPARDAGRQKDGTQVANYPRVERKQGSPLEQLATLDLAGGRKSPVAVSSTVL